MGASPELVYGLTLGMLAAVNPCGFPLLPAYLELLTGGRGTTPLATRVSRAVAAGACSTVGFLALFGVFGVVVEVGWSGVSSHAFGLARWLMLILGAGMVASGVATLAHRPLRIPLPHPGSGTGFRRPVASAVFGVSYGVASLGCALPLFVSGVATAFSSSDAWHGASLFVAYALGMGIVLCGLAVAVAVAGPVAARPLRRSSRLVVPLGAGLMVAIGAYLTLYWGTELVDPVASDPVTRAVTSAQQMVSSGISSHSEVVGAALGAVVVVGVVSVGLAGLRQPRSPVPAPPSSSPVARAAASS